MNIFEDRWDKQARDLKETQRAQSLRDAKETELRATLDAKLTDVGTQYLDFASKHGVDAWVDVWLEEPEVIWPKRLHFLRFYEAQREPEFKGQIVRAQAVDPPFRAYITETGEWLIADRKAAFAPGQPVGEALIVREYLLRQASVSSRFTLQNDGIISGEIDQHVHNFDYEYWRLQMLQSGEVGTQIGGEFVDLERQLMKVLTGKIDQRRTDWERQ